MAAMPAQRRGGSGRVDEDPADACADREAADGDDESAAMSGRTSAGRNSAW